MALTDLRNKPTTVVHSHSMNPRKTRFNDLRK